MLKSGRLDYTRFLHAAALSFFLCALASGQDQPNGNADSNQSGSGSTAAQPAVDPHSDWHVNLNVYLWFPGIHGIVGKNNFNLGYKTSATDLISHLRIGFMGLVGAQKGRFVTLADVVWIRLRADQTRGLPFPDVPEVSSWEKLYLGILTPEVGYRLLDGEKFKIDALGGVRYWHVQTNVNFLPALPAINLSKTANWADPLMGARFEAPLAPKLLAMIWGDAGGWGAGAQLDYQIVGALRYQVSSKWALDAGYRYLYLDYRPGTFKYESALSGALLGVTYSFK